MRRVLPASLLLLALVLQACQRDEATAPRPFGPNAHVVNPSTSKIAFTRNSQIYVVNGDGSGLTQLTTEGGLMPSWSPDGRRIAFLSSRGGTPGIFVMNADGSGETRLTSSPRVDEHPSWSPDGQQVVFNRGGGDDIEIFVINTDGTGLTQLTNSPPPVWNYDPRWSPDGRQIAFTSNRDGTIEIYVMNPDGSAQTRLTNGPRQNQQPSWSPDGTQIVFSSLQDHYFQLFVMNADGSALTQVTTSQNLHVEPSWSPDGRRIAFTSASGIYVVNADGTGGSQLTTSGGDRWPSWWGLLGRGRAPAVVAFTSFFAEGVEANAVISPAVHVTVTDASGDMVQGGVVHLEIGTSPAPGATLSGTMEAHIVDGVATFSDLSIDQPGRDYRLRAKAGLASGVSARFAIVGPATQLGFVTEPPAIVEEGATMSPPAQVAVQDALGSTVPSATLAVTVALAANPSDATLEGTTTVQAVHGVATFTDLTVDRAGSGYALAASAAPLTGATSTAFTVPPTFATVSTGINACALSVGGTAYCWGQGGNNGDGTTTFRQTPVPVVGAHRFKALATSYGRTCGLTTEGDVYCWGWPVLTPQPAASGFSFTAITIGSHDCGLTTGDVWYCWAPGSSPQPFDTEGHSFTVLSAGNSHLCGVTSTNAAYCRGINSYGQLGDGTYTTPQAPPWFVAVTGGLSFTTVSAGSYNNTCGVTTSGAAYCWGFDFGATPSLLSSGVTFTSIKTGWTHACGVAAGGDGYCWGENTYGELGIALGSGGGRVVGGLSWKAISAGSSWTCGVTTDGALYCWGNTTTGRSSEPVQVVP